MTEDELREIEARAEAATPGPWEVGTLTPSPDGLKSGIPQNTMKAIVCRGITDVIACTAEGVVDEEGRYCISEGTPNCNNDGDFIAHAREDIPALVAEVRRLRAALEFYAEKANWRTTSEGFAAQYDRASPAAVKDGGIMARLALMSQQEGEKQ